MSKSIFLFIPAIFIVLLLAAISSKYQLTPRTAPPTTSPTPIPETTWQTYRNDQYSFEFQYPSGWEKVTDNFSPSNISLIRELKPIITTIADKSVESSCGPYVCYSSISFYPPITNDSKLTNTKWLESFYRKNKLIFPNETGKYDYNFIESALGELNYIRDENRFFVFNNNKVYITELSIENKTDKKKLEETFNQILSTFKFIGQ